MKHLNISTNVNLKKLICLVSFLSLITLISSSVTSETTKRLSQTRSLAYSIGSIYYELTYPINNLTGTGDKLKDVPYQVQCRIKKCESGCCIGEIDGMLCGAAADCAIYLEKSKETSLIVSIVVPIGLLIIFLILFITFKKVYKISTGKSICFALGCLTIVLIPCVAYFVYQGSKNESTNEKQKEG